MDPALNEAATKGDVEFLKEAFSTQPSDYFITRIPKDGDKNVGGNIFHLAAWNDKVEFLKEAMSILPRDIQKQLLFQTSEDYEYIPLHLAAMRSKNNYEVLTVFKQMYESLSLSYEEDNEDGLVKPWLALNYEKMTPLHLALKDDKKNEKCALEILAMDTEFSSCAMVDYERNTPLVYALKNGFNLVAQKILMSSLSSSSIFATMEVFTPFGYAANCSEVVLSLLFQKFSDWLNKIDNNGCTIVHKWAEDGKAGFMKQMNASLSLWYEDKDGLVKPWLALNNEKMTPLHLALKGNKENENCAMEILAMDTEFASCTLVDNEGNTPLYYALKNGFNLVAEKILISLLPPSSLFATTEVLTPFAYAANCSEVVLSLLFNKYGDWLLKINSDGYTIVHKWAEDGKAGLLKQMKASLSLSLSYEDKDGLVKPWLALTHTKMTPLHLALKADKQNEKCAMEILAMDTDFASCTIVDGDGNTPLYYALKNGFNLVAENILMSPLSSSSIFASTKVLTPFAFAADCSEVVLRLLFKKYGDWLDKINDKGFTILHKWAEIGEARPCKVLLEEGDVGEARTKIFKRMVFDKENNIQNTPLHIAARKKDSELAQIFIRGYQQQQASASEGEIQELVTVECPPWRVKNDHGNTPLHIALTKNSKHEELALEILSIDSTVCNIRNNSGESPFFLAATSGCAEVVDAILKIEEPRFQMLRRHDGSTVFHGLSSCPEETGRRLLEKYWWIINLRDDSGKTALDYAKKSNALWLVSLLKNPSLIQKQDFDWVEACKRDETAAVLAFVDTCHDLQQTCRQENDTPLHHIKLPTYKEYVTFLNIPSIAELKNTIDHDGATALHRALERKDMLLAKVLLLDDEVERIIPDHNGTTSMDLLAKICKENDDWAKMCKLIKVNPYLKTSYIQPGTNLEQIRSTLSVVAALLATITFAAGFTLPGGLNSDSGEAILAKKAGFLVFLLADVYAMCTSMLVLFCLVWSMVSEPDLARLLIDRSVFLLMHSLYGTLVAFMAGIYTVINHSALWAAIIVFVMCSIIGISANRTILLKVIVKLVPAAKNKEKPDRMRSLEEGSADAYSKDNVDSSKIK